MDRRSFLQTAAVTATSLAVAPGAALVAEPLRWVRELKFRAEMPPLFSQDLDWYSHWWGAYRLRSDGRAIWCMGCHQQPNYDFSVGFEGMFRQALRDPYLPGPFSVTEFEEEFERVMFAYGTGSPGSYGVRVKSFAIADFVE